MQFNENGEELGEIGMKVLNETLFGQVVKTPKNPNNPYIPGSQMYKAAEEVPSRMHPGEESTPVANEEDKAKAKLKDAIASKWEAIEKSLDDIKNQIRSVSGDEYTNKVEAAIKSLTELVLNVGIMNNPAGAF